jgi:predicted RNase H-like HicB family nuclease
MAHFPALLRMAADGSFTATFPDLPGCLAVGDDADETMRLAEAALALHLEGCTLAGERQPTPGDLGRLIGNARASDATLVLVPARPPKAPAVRVNITIDKNLLTDIDAAAAEKGTTRSGFLAEGARRLMER